MPKSASPRRALRGLLFLLLVSCLGLLAACSRKLPFPGDHAPAAKPRLVATYSILGALTSELVGDAATVQTLVPNGLDVHEWEPSARDVEALMKADLIVENGLGLEGGLARSLAQAEAKGVARFVAADAVEVRIVGKGEGVGEDDPDQAPGAKDPHLWTDPEAMKAVTLALAARLEKDFGLDLGASARRIADELDALDRSIASRVASLPPERRKIVTGHESLGYFARRYGFTLVGALVPSLSSDAEASAASLARLKVLIAQEGVKVIFTEVGTPPRVAETLARESGVKALPLATHLLPPSGRYADFETKLAADLLDGLE